MPRTFWSEAEMNRLRELYPNLPTAKVAALLGRSLTATYGMAGKLDLHKSQQFLETPESGRLHKGESRPGTEATRFPKGHVPANKGIRRPGWAPGRMSETQFQKGVRSGVAAKNWCPIGTVRADPEGYLRIKVREAVYGQEPTGFGNTNVWPLYNRWIWQQHHGPIPPGHLVVFKDGDRSHCEIGNLELIPLSENARRNRMWNKFPREVALAIQLNGVLKRAIRSREENGEKQS